VGRTLT